MELDDLYDAVPAAQEEDLLDELVQERRHSETSAWLVALGVDEPEPAADELPVDEAPPLRPGQVLGLLEHQLGAVVLPDEDGTAT